MNIEETKPQKVKPKQRLLYFHDFNRLLILENILRLSKRQACDITVWNSTEEQRKNTAANELRT